MNADKAVAQTGDGTRRRPPRSERPPIEYLLFYRHEYRTLKVIAMHAGATSHEADELTAETLQQMYDAWAGITDRHAWARRALINNLKDLRRSQQRRMIRDGKYLAGSYERPAEPQATSLDDSEAREELLGLLTVRQRRIVELLLLDLNSDEVALLLGDTRERVRRTLADVRRRLDPTRRQSSSGSPQRRQIVEEQE